MNHIKKRILLMSFKKLLIWTIMLLGLWRIFAECRFWIVEIFQVSKSMEVFLLVLDILFLAAANIALHFLHREVRRTERRAWHICLSIYRIGVALGVVFYLIAIITGDYSLIFGKMAKETAAVLLQM